ncbi:BEM_HP_G0118630.mRNA.1.CDS.1 [Saccharomyces cerevisiae]|nr:BEM_HP_G0118630.mRNA.1.CDS.1 [Saccharomyces cerevisiae]CAI6403084.1 BEM_HP_G0118630.mRNA.1.CDS.1 [Saccharomyces cerevisiae]
MGNRFSGKLTAQKKKKFEEKNKALPQILSASIVSKTEVPKDEEKSSKMGTASNIFHENKDIHERSEHTDGLVMA